MAYNFVDVALQKVKKVALDLGKRVETWANTPSISRSSVLGKITTAGQNYLQSPFGRVQQSFLQGGGQGASFGLAQPTQIKPQTIPEKVAQGVGFGVGAFNPYSLGMKGMGALANVGNVATRGILSRVAPKATGFVAKKLLPVVGQELAQTAGYGAATVGLGNKFNPVTDLAFGLGMRGLGPAVGAVGRKFSMPELDLKEMYRAADVLKDKKASPELKKAATLTMDVLSERHLDKATIDKLKGNPLKLYNELIKRAEKGTLGLNKTIWGIKSQGGVPEGGVGVNAPSQLLKSPTAEAVQTGRTPIPEVATATKPKLQPELPVPKPPVAGGGQAGVPSPPIIDPIQKITEALKLAKPLEAKQAGIYSKIRAKQAGAIAGVGKNIPGEAGFHAQLGQLKGEMPKVEFESIRKQITQPDIDSLFNKVEQANITPFEKITAKSGLAKLLGAEGGSVPVQSELKLLSEIFPPEFIQSVLEKRSVMQKLFSFGTEALNLPRAMMATADFSAPLRQGVFLIGKPKQWLPAFRDQFKYFFNEKAYKGLAEEIKARPTYQAMRQNKLAITDMSPLLQSREEAFMSNLAEKIPGFGKLARASNRAYSGFLNKLRADVFDDMYKNAKTLGLDMDTVGPDIAKFVNAATGRGNLGALERAAPVLNGAFFSPRLMASRLNLLNPAFYVKLDPFVRKEAIKSLLTFAGTGMTVLGLAKLAGADVGTDPTSSDFGKIKVGNTRMDIWGGFQQYMRAAGQLITGRYTSSTTGKEYTLGEGYKPLTRLGIIGRVIESKESPILSFISTLLTGQNGLGGKLDVPVEILDRFTPMMLSGFYDLYKEGGLKEMGLGLPSIFGVGVQTYGRQIPTQETTPAGKPTIKLKPVPGLSEDIINKVRGTPVSNIPQEKWAGIVNAKTKDQQLKILKDKVKQNPQSTDKQILNQNNIYVTGEGEFVDLNPVISMPTTSSYEELQRQKKAYSLTDDILKLPVEEQAKAFSSIGISPDDATYYQVAKGATDLKTAYINDGIGGLDTKNRGDLINYLVSQRREVNGDMVLTNTIVTDLLNRDIISQTEATMLKNLKIVNGKPVTKLTGRGKKTALKKVSAPKAPTKIKAPNMKTLLAKTVKLKTKRYKFKRSFA